MRNGTILLTAILSYGGMYSIMNGTAQEVIHFSSEWNEMGCASILFTMGTLSMIGLDWKGLWRWITK